MKPAVPWKDLETTEAEATDPVGVAKIGELLRIKMAELAGWSLCIAHLSWAPVNSFPGGCLF